MLVRVPDPEGRNEKSRPALVFRVDGQRLWIACVSTTFDHNNVKEFEIALPFSADGRAMTGLTRKSVVICSWVGSVDRSDCTKIGYVPAKLMTPILDQIKKHLDSKATATPPGSVVAE